ncbi:hypothetical protein MOQ_005224 [Trypanosoma cruzi marinkellei]|uniref:CHASE domain-containing protein n=1 Tax=Trypanosoma cruzi marinkellei TaxID=85056 RepID=K2N850_TRYCR|nr:hypothetical protein MOQ_005224 [Trypanosoma cruzi marinkellei]
MGDKPLKTSQRKVYWLIGTGIFSALVLIICIAVPISVYQTKYQRMRETRIAAEIFEVDRWVSFFRSDVIDAISTAYGLEGFALGSMKFVPPFNGTPEERVKGQEFAGFTEYASLLRVSPHLVAQILAPGGVGLEVFPPVPAIRMFDFLKNDSMGEPTAMESVDSKKSCVLGPLYRAVPGINATWQLIVRDPIYDTKDNKKAERKTFWGFALVVLNVDTMMGERAREDNMHGKGIDYLLYTVKNTSGKITPIRFSVKENPTLEEITDFISTGTNRAVLRNRLSWYVCMRGRNRESTPTKTTIAVIIVVAFLIALVTFLASASTALLCLKEYDGTANAPKAAPFAMTILGLCSAEQLWELSPDRMVFVSERLATLQRQEIIRHNAYEGMQLHPYTTTIITRSVETAVRLCFSVIEELNTQPIDEPLQELLGDDGRLLIACAVHWCTEATVRVESVSGAIRYEGPDVVYCGRMWMFAAPNEVSISRAARDLAMKMDEVQINSLASVFLRGVAGRQDLFTISNPQRKRLVDATTRAKRRIPSSFAVQSPSAEIASEGNPLSAGAELFPRNGMYPPCNSEMRGVSSNATAQLRGELSSGSVGSRGGNAILDTNMSACGRYMPEVSRGFKRFSQINGVRTLIELLPTEIACPSEAAGLDTSQRPSSSPLSRDHVGSTMDEGHMRPRTTPTDEEKEWRRIPKGGQFIAMGRNNTANWSKKTLKQVDQNVGNGVVSFSGGLRVEDLDDGDFVTEVLRHPTIPTFVDTQLRAIFEQQSLLFDFSYDSVRTVVYYFFSAFKLLLKPLATPERNNIFNRLVTVFGIPQENILEHLAVRCVLRYIQQLEEARSLLWNCEQQLRLRSLARGQMRSFTTIDSSTTNPLSEESFEELSRSIV